MLEAVYSNYTVSLRMQADYGLGLFRLKQAELFVVITPLLYVNLG